MGSDVALSTPREGDVVEGRYRIERELGRGGMGVVCAAIDIESGQRWALKFLRDDPENPRRRQRFLREAEAMMAVHHPHIVQIRETCGDGPLPFLAMELIEGESLGARLGRGALPTTEAATITAAIASAVGAAHSAGVIHRDLKPDNVLLASDGNPRVVDFGIAKLPTPAADGAASLTATDEILGTPHYMSPEQVFGERLDLRTDVWSLGVILYECLCGRRPFRGENVGQVLKAISATTPAVLARGLASSDPTLSRLACEMMSARPGDRPADMRAIVRRLAPLLASPVPEPGPPAESVVGGDDDRRDATTLQESGALVRAVRPGPLARRGSVAVVTLILIGGAAFAVMIGRSSSSPDDKPSTSTKTAPSAEASATTPDASSVSELAVASAPPSVAAIPPMPSASIAKGASQALPVVPPPRPAVEIAPSANTAAPSGSKRLPGGVASEMPF